MRLDEQWPVTKSIDGFRFTCSWPAVTHHLLLCRYVKRLRSCKSQSLPVFHAVVNSVRQLHRFLMGCAGNSHLAETDSGSRKHDMRLSSKKYFCIRVALNWNNHIKCIRPPSWCRERLSRPERKLWLLHWDHVFCYFRGDSIQHTSNIYINFVSLLSFLKQLCKPPIFFQW